MVKSIIKEIFIILLVCVAIALVMAVIFYNYIPTNKVVPTKVTAYKTPENIESEITADTIGNYTTQQENFTVEEQDLKKYTQSKSYNPGKPDPFAEYTEEVVTGNTANGEGSSTNTTNTSKPTTNPNVTDNYYTSQNVNKGTK